MSNYESGGTGFCTDGLEETRRFPVVRLDVSQIQSLATVLNQAFQNEPPFKYLLPDERTRYAVLPWFFHSIARASHLSGEIYATANIEGGALWISPGRAFSFERIVRSGLSAAPFQSGLAGLRRCIKLGACVDAVHRQLAVGPHWYLMALGVKPSRLGSAIGAALLQPVLSQADADGFPCYLETFRERDLPFYAARGFRVEGAGSIPGGGPNFWAMMRAPQ